MDEHLRIIDREVNPENKAFYEMLWHLGGAQSDIANLMAENIDYGDRVIAFHRKKNWAPSLIRFGPLVASILKGLPKIGPLFPHLRTLRASVRSDFFRKRCATVRVSGVTLHSYRYAFAERCRVSGVPERAAMEMLGHQSESVNRAYAKKAKFITEGLESYERKVARKFHSVGK